MKTIIAGSRTISDPQLIQKAVDASGFIVTEVLCGGARGVDTIGKQWAERNGIPVLMFPADWETHGCSAGFVRNQQMADACQAVIAIWDGKSNGTKDMIHRAKKAGKLIYIHWA